MDEDLKETKAVRHELHELKDINLVGAAIIDDGKVLVDLRADGESMAGYWEFPGGKVTEHESLQDALHKKVAEKLDCGVEIESELCSSEYQHDFGMVHLTTFVCHVTSGTPTKTDQAEIRWVPLAELPDLNMTPVSADAVDILSKMTTD